MRTPQRNFVVEYKSARRRSAMPAASIWGNTDFKALVRDAEAAHPFGGEEHLKAPTQEHRESSSPKLQEDLADHNDTVVDQLASASSAEAVRQISRLADEAPAIRDVFPTDQDIKQQSETVTARRPGGPRKRRFDDTGTAATHLAGAQPDVPTMADLAVLEEENKQLKHVFAKHLHEQNLRLRSMLARFEAPEQS